MVRQGRITAVSSQSMWRSDGFCWAARGRGEELGLGPAHLLVRAVAVLLDRACADEHIGAATGEKQGQSVTVAWDADQTLLPVGIHLAVSVTRLEPGPKQTPIKPG